MKNYKKILLTTVCLAALSSNASAISFSRNSGDLSPEALSADEQKIISSSADMAAGSGLTHSFFGNSSKYTYSPTSASLDAAVTNNSFEYFRINTTDFSNLAPGLAVKFLDNSGGGATIFASVFNQGGQYQSTLSIGEVGGAQTNLVNQTMANSLSGTGEDYVTTSTGITPVYLKPNSTYEIRRYLYNDTSGLNAFSLDDEAFPLVTVSVTTLPQTPSYQTMPYVINNMGKEWVSGLPGGRPTDFSFLSGGNFGSVGKTSTVSGPANYGTANTPSVSGPAGYSAGATGVGSNPSGYVSQGVGATSTIGGNALGKNTNPNGAANYATNGVGANNTPTGYTAQGLGNNNTLGKNTNSNGTANYAANGVGANGASNSPSGYSSQSLAGSSLLGKNSGANGAGNGVANDGFGLGSKYANGSATYAYNANDYYGTDGETFARNEAYRGPYKGGYLSKDRYLEYVKKQEQAQAVQAQQMAQAQQVTQQAPQVLEQSRVASIDVTPQPDLFKETKTLQVADANPLTNLASNFDDSKQKATIWGRYLGSNANVDEGNGKAGYDANFNGAQAGIDIPLTDTFKFGLLAGYGTLNGDATALGQSSSFKTDAYSVGLSGTWNEKPNSLEGAYAQGVVLFQDSNYEVGSKADVDGKTYVVSAETGYGLRAGQSSYIEPQAQLIYTNTKVDDFIDADGLSVAKNKVSQLTGRLGVRAATAFKSESIENIVPFVTANYYNNLFTNDEGNTVNRLVLDANEPKSIYEVKAGLNTDITKTVGAFGDVGYAWGSDYDSVAGHAGLKYSW